MRATLKPQSFKRWRKRVHEKVSIKHRKRFVLERQADKEWGQDALHYKSSAELEADLAFEEES